MAAFFVPQVQDALSSRIVGCRRIDRKVAMSSGDIKRSIQTDVLKLESCTLTDIRVRTFCVEFVFSESLTIIVKAKKDFRFELKSGGGLYFDPTRTIHDFEHDSAKFIFLQGMHCQGAILKETVFEVRFAEGSRLWMEFDDSDFEPLELVGLSGQRHDKFEFHHVV